MVLLYIFLGILAFLGLILFLPLHIGMRYDGESGFVFRLKFAWITLYDSGKEKKPSAPKEEKKDKEEKPKKEKKEKKGSSALTALLNFLGLQDIASIANAKTALEKKGLQQMLEDLGTAVGQLFGRIGKLFCRGVFHKFTLRITVGDEDAADCAINYGRICAAVYPTITLLDSAFTFRQRSVDIRCDFSQENTQLFYEGLLRYRPWNFVCFLGGLVINYLKRSVT